MNMQLRVNNARLFAFSKAAFMRQSLLAELLNNSKRHPLDNFETGPEAATRFLSRRRLSATSTRSLRKVDRANRIWNGAAQEKYGVPGKRERKVIRRMLKAA